ncbi:acetamidase/formamidase family protein [Kribbella pratensis]|uniref:Acetamidase/formamidase n=1 Tax=Kribbella pratensis TaxID=2512112 RepID=A0A4R8CNK8_9ACTN|nr:acetamidase/formamidase family protein [Kribbella pratensis]TDW77709.1 acetamidase/formamidase [Kribbella pratensis]
MDHKLDATPETTVDVFGAGLPTVLTIDPGDTLTVHSLDASGYLAPQRTPGEQQPKMFAEARGHCLTGPIAIRGAQPGDLLAVHLVSLTPDPWGWTVAGALKSPITERLGVTEQPSWLLWELDPDAGTGRCNGGFTRELAPFLGVIGVVPEDTGEHSTIPPRALGGGNIDCKSLVAGSTLYLPVAVADAMLSLGDGHAAQGDGEVGGTAIECPMTTTLTVDLVREPRPVESIHAETPDGRITFGFDADLNVATGDALDAMVRWMQAILDVDKSTALALASTAVDLRITQVANQTWGVHALLPSGVLA